MARDVSECLSGAWGLGAPAACIYTLRLGAGYRRLRGEVCCAHLTPLERLLLGVQRPGDYCVQGVLEVPLPRVEVDGMGMLSFPVPQVQIQQLIQQATRAPYGRGEATILDESVRKVWQLPPEKVRELLRANRVPILRRDTIIEPPTSFSALHNSNVGCFELIN